MKKPDPVVEVQDTFLTNINRGRTAPPAGQPWVAYLFCRTERGKRHLEILEGTTQDDRDAKVAAYVEGWRLVQEAL